MSRDMTNGPMNIQSVMFMFNKIVYTVCGIIANPCGCIHIAVKHRNHSRKKLNSFPQL